MAAGRGTRLGADRPKALVPLGHGPDATPLVTHALRGVLSCPGLSDVVVVAPPDHLPEFTEAVELVRVPAEVGIQVVAGGAERTDSVAAGLAALPADVGIVLVHDAARACTPTAVFERVVAAVRDGHPAVIPAVRVSDTIKAVDAGNHVVATPERSTLRAVQTPQGFLRQTLERAHAQAGGAVTDDAGLVEAHGGAVYVVDGDPRSLKVTGPEDLATVAAWVQRTAAPALPGAMRPDGRDGSAGTAPGAHLVASVTPEDVGAGRQPVLLVLGGPPGVGKTTLARAWARHRRAVHVRVDTIEQALVRAGAAQIGPEGYAAASALAVDQLRLGLDVVADSVNPLPVTRRAWREQAALAGARVLEVELTCASAEHRDRVETREADIPGHHLPDWAGVQAAGYAPWAEAALSLDTTGQDVGDLVARIEEMLGVD